MDGSDPTRSQAIVCAIKPCRVSLNFYTLIFEQRNDCNPRRQATFRRNECPEYPAQSRISRRFCSLNCVRPHQNLRKDQKNMLIEQAFHNLPEILLGAGYARQEYAQGFEASIVGAFSLAILQELNGRNASNPISFFMAEKRYPDLVENVRADLHIDLARLFTGSEAYSNFGFRFSNWIEAKYFRVTNGTPPNTQNLGAIAADLIRLITLIPKEPAANNKTKTGRYFLHVYQGDPFNKKHVISTRADKTKREWIEDILKLGYQENVTLDLSKESKWDSFFKHIPKKFENAIVKMNVTNYVLSPTTQPDNELYTIALTRIDSATFEIDTHKLELTQDRRLVCNEEFDEFRKIISSALKPKKERAPRKKNLKKAPAID